MGDGGWYLFLEKGVREMFNVRDRKKRSAKVGRIQVIKKNREKGASPCSLHAEGTHGSVTP
jgi:hypothetical protein